MPLPPELLQAISTPGGGRVALVLGAGCSVEAPTSIPVARRISEEIHRQLVEDGVLENGNCANPADLSLLADAVFDRRGSQRDVVERLLAKYHLKLATANDGYLTAAALLMEGALFSIVSLNFDLAITDALSSLGAGSVVGIIEAPEDLPRQKAVNVYYLHRNANSDPELWVLRTATLTDEWRLHWEAIVAVRVLAAPVIVFAGLGTPAAVLIESSRLIRNAVPNASMYQVDPINADDSQFFREAGIGADHYIRLGWGDFMEQLSSRLVTEHIHLLEERIGRKIIEDALHQEDVNGLLMQFRLLGLVKQGRLRADWLLSDTPYRSVNDDTLGLVADLLVAVAMMIRVSETTVRIVDDGLIEFQRNGRTVAASVLASGRGYRSISAIEAEIGNRRRRYDRHQVTLSSVIVAGTSDVGRPLTPPADIALGEVITDDLVGSVGLPIYHVNELRADPARLRAILS
jgi:hypothetical protein